jgi:hypothetical protein
MMDKDYPKKKYSPIDRAGALSLFAQARKSMLNNEALPPHVANYLLEAFNFIEVLKEDANIAFCLTWKKPGNPNNKRWRNFLFRKQIALLMKEGMKKDAAIEKEMSNFEFKSSDTAESSYKDGTSDFNWYKEIADTLGDVCAENYAEIKKIQWGG